LLKFKITAIKIPSKKLILTEAAEMRTYVAGATTTMRIGRRPFENGMPVIIEMCDHQNDRSSLLLNDLDPVFVDINKSYNIETSVRV
jgi:hypothetical protein